MGLKQYSVFQKSLLFEHVQSKIMSLQFQILYDSYAISYKLELKLQFQKLNVFCIKAKINNVAKL